MLRMPTPPQNRKESQQCEFKRKREYMIKEKEEVYNLLFNARFLNDTIQEAKKEQNEKNAVYDLIFRS
tara:strand:- start:1306 stop:1509 length:204 start_codon:yes stop_codon:yes gene_type:complete